MALSTVRLHSLSPFLPSDFLLSSTRLFSSSLIDRIKLSDGLAITVTENALSKYFSIRFSQ